MRRLLSIFTLLAILSGGTAIGHNHPSSVVEEKDSVYQAIELPNEMVDVDDVFLTVDEMPQFPGGLDGLMEFLNTNIVYPTVAAERQIEGSVLVQFVVEKDGSISNVRILRSVDINLDYEAIRVCKNLPKFIPGRKNGEVVRVLFALPINFKLT